MSKIFSITDFQKLSLINLKLHPCTTQERNQLALTLGLQHKGLLVTDTDTSELYIWNGQEFVSQKTEIPPVPPTPETQSSVPLIVTESVSWKIQQNSQVLFTEEIQLDGELDIEGSLSEVN